MLLARAFVFGLSPRAVLAVAALALSVAYALTAAGALSTLDPQGATLESAQANPGIVLHHGGESTPEAMRSFPAATAPDDALLVDWVMNEETKVASIWPGPNADPALFPGLQGKDAVLVGAHASPAAATALAEGLGLGTPEPAHPMEYAPQDSLLIPRDAYLQAFPERDGQARLAYLPGQEAPPTGFQTSEWQGLAGFFTAGMQQLSSSLIAVVAASGLLAALLASGLLYLEVLARRRDLATVVALAGLRTARRLVIARTLVLVAAGLTAGLLLALVTLRVGSAAIGTPLSVPVVVWVMTGLGVALGATLFGALAGLRALHRHALAHGGSQAIPIRRFPGPIRFLTVTPRVFAGLFAATLVTSAVLLTLTASTAIPYTLFQADGGDTGVYVSGGSGYVMRGSVDRFLGAHAHLLPGVETALSETYAPTILDGRAIMVRGTDHEVWRSVDTVRLAAGAWPAEPGDATIGTRAARVHGLAPGDIIVVPASYHRGVETIRITGTHETGGLFDDQLVPDLGAAARLAGLPPDRVTGIRMTLTQPGGTWELVAPQGVAVSQVRLDPPNPVPFTPATVHVTLINFDPVSHDHPVAVRVNGILAASNTVTMAARSVSTTSYGVTAPLADVVRIEVNPTQSARTQAATLRLELPDVARPGETFTIGVTTPAGEAVADAMIRLDGIQAATTNAQGQAELIVPGARLAALSAQHGDDAAGAQLRVAPAAWDDTPRLAAEQLHIHPPRAHDAERFQVRIAATIVNLGGAAHDGALEWQAGETTGSLEVELASGARTTVETDLTLPYGTHTLAIAGLERNLTVQSADASGPADPSIGDAERAQSIEEVIAAKRAARDETAPRAGAPGDSFLERVFADLESAAVLVVLATIIHGGALIWVSVLRDVRERAAIPPLLRQLGASQDQVRTRTARDAVVAAAPPILLGLLAAWGVLLAARFLGHPAAFGHTLPFEDAPGFLVRTGAALLFIAVLAALYGIQTGRRTASGVATRRPLAKILDPHRATPTAASSGQARRGTPRPPPHRQEPTLISARPRPPRAGGPR